MSRASKYIDNEPMENFWGVLKAERYYLKGKYNTYEELKNDIKNYMKFYNNERLQKRLNSMAPLEYRAMLLRIFIYLHCLLDKVQFIF